MAQRDRNIWASIAVPRVANSITYHRAEAAATRIVRDITLTQAQAKATSTSQKIAFDVAADCYAVSGMQDLDRSTEPYVVRVAEPPYEAQILFVNFKKHDHHGKIFYFHSFPKQSADNVTFRVV